ncbi:MAG: outer membrane beta-barrel protein [Gammaproteobacteria bacterium]
MTKLQRSTRFLIVLAAALPSAAAAQRLGVSVGYTRIPGRIGGFESNEGIAARVGFEFNPRSIARFGFEAGWERLNESRRLSQTVCIHPAGGTATCNTDSRQRDTGLSLAAILRAGPNGGTVRPYGLLGLEAMQVRTHDRDMTTDSTGAHLRNFEIDGVHTEGAFGVPLGAGVLFRSAGSPFAIQAEARLTPLIHNYSGGLMLDWSPSLTVGVRLGM